MIDFGDIFRHKEEMYVYLVQAGELIFAAKILDPMNTNLIVKMRDMASKKPFTKTDQGPRFCFVVLSTEDFEDCAAHYGAPMMPIDCAPEAIKRLCTEDIEKLRKEIIADGSANILLRETITRLSKKK